MLARRPARLARADSECSAASDCAAAVRRLIRGPGEPRRSSRPTTQIAVAAGRAPRGRGSSTAVCPPPTCCSRSAAPPRARRGRADPPAAARRPAPRLRVDARHGARLRGEGGRVHPGDRRRGPPVLGLPRLPRPQARRAATSAASTRPTTRTLMGNAYPTPGLHGKFYDQDMDPLVEVVRDTVGRHDTFALACNAKYYEDLGYFGHVNCTDNFNGAAAAVHDRARARAGPRSTSSSTRRSTRRTMLRLRRAVVAARRLRAAARARPTSCASRARAPTTSTRRTPGTRPRSRARVPGRRSGSRCDRAPRHPDAEPKLTRETGVPPAHRPS